ncbi:PA14 domain-containing protein [Massilia sp. Root335]|uniref:PA14 domain-containing protein n=1 Tax=Massilia sp. Root335 TaxID=1736517 RepID=UPI0006F2EEF7|nr:PA14 domain-containing protein [Massilia sp. Root335]KQV40850.1 hypothetical protein ASC93_16740 [Massilia sp. Root335]
MRATQQEPSPRQPEAAPDPQWRRASRRHALAIVVLIHIALLTTVLLSRVPRPKLPKASTTNVTLFQEKVPKEKILESKPAESKAFDLPPPTMPEIKVPPPPVPDVVPDAIRSPVTAPAPVSAPVPRPPPVEAAAVASAAVTAPAAPPKLFEECGGASDRHMVADVYRLRRDARSVTEMRGQPVKRVCLAQLDITPRSFLEGFPGMGSTVEWFGLDIRFTVTIAEPATWEILLLADDGAILSIDDENVIDNDGIHAPTPVATQVKLEKGPHNFRVRYFQGPGPDLALMLAWKKPGAADYGYLPRSLIGRPPAGMLKALQPKG